jgi:hypothetical protein
MSNQKDLRFLAAQTSEVEDWIGGILPKRRPAYGAASDCNLVN